LPFIAGWRLAPVCVVEQGRVAIGDEIGEALGAPMAVVLIGERPGLTSPDSLGVYITWDPKRGRRDSERNCISNVREEGLGYAAAAGRLHYYMQEASRRHLSGLELKDPATDPTRLL
jgi:ethanolamine ammonia-lyase small subunit